MSRSQESVPLARSVAAQLQKHEKSHLVLKVWNLPRNQKDRHSGCNFLIVKLKWEINWNPPFQSALPQTEHLKNNQILEEL